jgi:RimJ/RimL family protein N-acetyltransferase
VGPTDPRSDRRALLTPLRVEDAAEMAEVLADPALHAFTGGRPPTPEELRARYAVLVSGWSPDRSQRWLNWVVRLRSDRRAVGYTQATIDPATGTAELAWVVGVPWQGRGIAGEAVDLMLEELAGKGVTRYVAHIHPDHAASAGVARRAGLRPTDRLVDGEVEWESAPAQPRPLAT